jgi:hypothetical protein
MIDTLPDPRQAIDVPPLLLLICIVSLLIALHYSSTPKDMILGARSDRSVREAQERQVLRPKWLGPVMTSIGFSLTAICIVAALNPQVLDFMIKFFLQ